jgi:hypothetical protein
VRCAIYTVDVSHRFNGQVVPKEPPRELRFFFRKPAEVLLELSFIVLQLRPFGPVTPNVVLNDRGDNLPPLRELLDLPYYAALEGVGLYYSTLIKLESGVNKNRTVKTLPQLAGALGVSLDQLVEDESPFK